MAILTQQDQKRIESIIEDISFRTGFDYPNSDLLDLARAEDIKVIEGDLTPLGQNISGVIEYDDDELKSNPRIFVSAHMSAERKKFTLAHELGHHFLHKGRKLRLDVLDYSKNDKDTKEESEANYFAACLLVPKDLLLKKVGEGASVEEIARYFHVSVPVVKTRLRWIRTN